MSTVNRHRVVTLLLASVSLAAVSPADAARVLFSSATSSAGSVPTGDLPAGQTIQTSGGTIQVMLDSGAIVSFVGSANFSLGNDGAMSVVRGAATVLTGPQPTTIGLPGGSAEVRGAGSFTLNGDTIDGRALAGAIALTSGGQTREIASGQSFGFALGSVPVVTFAAPAQAVPGAAGAQPQQLADSALQQNPSIPAIPKGTAADVASYLAAATNLPGSTLVTQLAALAGPSGTGPVVGTTPTSPPTTGGGTPVVTTPIVTTPVTTPPVTTPPVVTPPVVTPPVVTPPIVTPPVVTPTNPVATSSVRGVALLGRNSADSSAGGDPGVVTVGFDVAGNAVDFGLYGKTLTATVAESHSGTGWTIGRYASGDFQRGTGTFATSLTLGANDGIHYAAVAPLTGVTPTGLATYTVASFTQPTLASGSAVSGATFAATLGVAFGTVPLVGYNGTLSFTDGGVLSSYSFTTPGGAAAPSMTNKLYRGSATNVQIYGQAPLVGTGTACATGSTCRLDLTGIFGAADATLFGAWYAVSDITLRKTTLNGAAIFTQTSVDPTNTVGTPPTTGGGTPGSGVDLATPNGSGLSAGTLVANYAGGNTDTRITVGTGYQNVAFDTNGNVSSMGQLIKNGGKLLEVNSGSGWTIGRFGDGNVTANGSANSYGVQQGISFFALTPTLLLPTSGTAYYSVSQATQPTFANGSFAPGGSFSANLGIAFGSTIAYGYDGRLTLPNAGGTFDSYSFVAGGGSTAPSLTNGTLINGGFFIDARASVSAGDLCSSSSACLLYLRGGTGGANASLFGATYELYNVNTSKQLVNGAAIFAKTGGTGAAAIGAINGGAGSPPTYIVSYAARQIGVETRAGVTAQFASDNGLASFYASYQEAPTKGSTTSTAAYSDPMVSIGRWAGGSTGGIYNGSNPLAIPGEATFAYAIGSQATNLPASGTLSYALLGATPVGYGDGASSAGSVTSAAMGVTFGATSRVGLEFAVSMPNDGTYGFTTTGGAANPSASNIVITPPNAYTAVTRFAYSGNAGLSTSGGRACATGAACSISLQGFFAGDRVQRAGLVFALGANGAVGADTVRGAIAFGNDGGLDVPALPPAPTPESTGSIGSAFVGSGSSIITYAKDGQTRLTAYSSSLNLGYDAASALSSIQVSNAGVNIARNTAVTGEAYGTANVQIGRWNGGTLTGTPQTTLAPGTQGLHYAMLNPATALPTSGFASFALAGATKPTYGDGFAAEGSFAGSLAVAFDTAKRVGLDLTVTMPDRTYNVITAGGVAEPGKSTATLNNTNQFAGLSVAATGGTSHACPDASCVFTAQGGLSGTGGREFAFSYTIGSSTTSFNNYIFGAAAFASASAASTPITLDARSTNSTASFANGNYTILTNASQPIRANNAMTFGPQHQLTAGATDTIGSNRISEVGSRALVESGGAATAFMGWGRWTGGRTGGGVDLTSGRGMHYVYGTPTTVFPTSGTATYQLIGATAPTASDGTHAAGTLDSASLAIAFGSTNRVGFNAAFTMPGDASYTIATTGGSANPATSALTISGGQATFASNIGNATATATPVGASSFACGSAPCASPTINGVLFGPQAAGVGIGYAIGSANQVAGVVTFARTN